MGNEITQVCLEKQLVKQPREYSKRSKKSNYLSGNWNDGASDSAPMLTMCTLQMFVLLRQWTPFLLRLVCAHMQRGTFWRTGATVAGCHQWLIRVTHGMQTHVCRAKVHHLNHRAKQPLLSVHLLIQLILISIKKIVHYLREWNWRSTLRKNWNDGNTRVTSDHGTVHLADIQTLQTVHQTIHQQQNQHSGSTTVAHPVSTPAIQTSHLLDIKSQPRRIIRSLVITWS